MMRTVKRVALFVLVLAACSQKPVVEQKDAAPPPLASAPAAVPDAAPPPQAAPETDLAKWLKAHVPATAEIVADGGTTKVRNKVAAGDTSASIAEAYLAVTDVYYAKDLAAKIAKNALTAGSTIEIPNVLQKAYADDPRTERMGWPEDKGMRGIFITGTFARFFWPQTLEKVAARLPRINAIVLDAKDY